MVQNDPRSARRRPGASSPSTTGRPGQVVAQIGADGGGITVDSAGDVGVRVAPGVSVEVTPADGCVNGM